MNAPPPKKYARATVKAEKPSVRPAVWIVLCVVIVGVFVLFYIGAEMRMQEMNKSSHEANDAMRRAFGGRN